MVIGQISSLMLCQSKSISTISSLGLITLRVYNIGARPPLMLPRDISVLIGCELCFLLRARYLDPKLIFEFLCFDLLLPVLEGRSFGFIVKAILQVFETEPFSSSLGMFNHD